MKNIYDITGGQLAVVWAFGLVAWVVIFLYAAGSYEGPSGLGVALWLLIPFALAFYSIGWKNRRKKA